jgi:PAS domain S-box-containing protein
MDFRETRLSLVWLVIILTSAIFLIDLFTPDNYEVWIAYLIPLLIAARAPRLPAILAGVCTVLIVADLFLPFPVIASQTTLLNRGLAIAATWVTAILLLQRQRTEAALRKSEIKYRRLHESMADAFVSVDMTGRIQEFNASYQAMLGYSADELHQLTYVDLTPEKWHAFEAEIVRDQILRHSFSGVYEKEYRRKDGTVFPVEMRTFLIRDDAGAPEAMWAIVRDITERKLAEAELRIESSAISSATAGIALADLDGKINYVNAAWLKMFGYESLEQIAGTLPSQHAQEPAKAMAVIEAIKTQGRWSGEMVCRRRDGTHFPTDMAANVVTDSDGRPIRLLASFSDITERVWAETALRESEDMLTALMSNLPGMVYRCANDPDWTIFFVSDGCRELTGYGPDELLHNRVVSYGTLIHPEDRDWLWAKCEASLEARTPCQNEYRIIDKAGRTRWVYERATGNYAPDGKLIFIEGFIQEVTARKAAEQALRESERRYRELFEANPHPMWVYDIQTLQFLAVNDAAIAHYGYSREEFLGRTIADIRPAEDVERLLAKVQAVTEGFDNAGVWRHQLKGGSLIEVEVVSHTLDFGGRRAELVLANNITARRKAEAAQQALTRRLQTVREEERARLARELHDQLGQALTGLKMDLGWLGRRGAPSEKLAEMTERINETIETVRRLSTELRPGVLDDLGLAAALEWQAENFQQRSGIRCEFVGKAPALDAERSTALFRIFQESLTNVARHAQAKRVTTCLSVADGEVMLEVADDGSGITPAAVTAPQSLGLLGMRERAAAVGGTVEIRGVHGKGTTVTVKIPTWRKP